MRPIRTVLWEGRRCELVAAFTYPIVLLPPYNSYTLRKSTSKGEEKWLAF